jgi:SWI/SNF-related matrix-associated actin-dependent regulator of chromatin subfamily A3
MMGEMVVLSREPNNQYDSNAIRVNNVRGELIGHIPRTIASKLAPFMDSRKLLIEAETSGPKDHYECPVALKLNGTNDPTARAILKEEMKAAQLPTEGLLRQEREEKAREKARLTAKKEREKMIKAARKEGMGMPGSQGGSSQIPLGSGKWTGGPSQGNGLPNLEDIIKESIRFNPRNVDQMVEQFGMKDNDLANMDKADQPAMVKTQLLPYQLQVRQLLKILGISRSCGKKTARRSGIFKIFQSYSKGVIRVKARRISGSSKRKSARIAMPFVSI